ncbi:unnamed protein product, partial [Rotaria sp. Silwood2]
MRQITNEFYRKSMELYCGTAAREYDSIKNEVEQIMENNQLQKNKKRSNILNLTEEEDEEEDGYPNNRQQNQDNDEEEEKSYAAFKQYHDLRIKRLNLEAEQSCYFLEEQRAEGEIDVSAEIAPAHNEYELLKLGPRFIFNDSQTASRRRITELATLRRKIENRLYEKKVSPGRPVQQFIDELDTLLQNLHNSTSSTTYSRKIHQTINQNTPIVIPDHHIISSQSQTNIRSINTKKKNYHRLIKRLKHKFRLTNTVIRKTDKSKVFHLDRVDEYQKKSNEYMIRTNTYKCLGTNNPLPDLIQRTNKYLLDLRLAKWITQKQYEQLCIKADEVELAHLYYLPKAHKLRTPLRPIISGLKHPTIKISKFLDDLLRPLFDKMA